MAHILSSYTGPVRAVVIGASGGIGQALCAHILAQDALEHLYAFGRSQPAITHDKCTVGQLDYADEASIETAAQAVDRPNLIIVATGMLHNAEGIEPEKSLRDLSADKFAASFLVNTTGPALVAKHFLPLLPREERGVFAALSARVGSISDNGLGGWYAYRAAKAALNMVIRNAAIEMGRRYKQAVIVGLHPGTVDTALSAPFKANVKPEKLFTPEQAGGYLLTVLDGLNAQDSGHCYDWAGTRIQP
jgi:NAD(P)-dependent dehydrogenase (short-subunit alcohol dehydrogenase family)